MADKSCKGTIAVRLNTVGGANFILHGQDMHLDLKGVFRPLFGFDFDLLFDYVI